MRYSQKERKAREMMDVNQMAAMRAQVDNIRFNQQIQQQQLTTQQSALAHDACKFIVENRPHFDEDTVSAAFATIALISKIFAPQVSPPPQDEELPQHESQAPDEGPIETKPKLVVAG